MSVTDLNPEPIGVAVRVPPSARRHGNCSACPAVSAMDEYLEPIGGAGGAAALTAVAAAAAYYYVRRPSPVKPLVDLEQQTVEEVRSGTLGWV